MNVIVKIGLTALIVVMAVPMLVIEPGPLSETAAFIMIGSLWGADFGEALE